MVLAFNTGVVYDVPVTTKLPPDTASYQLKVPAEPDAVSVAVVPAQMVVLDAVGAVGIGVTLTVTAVLLLAQDEEVNAT